MKKKKLWKALTISSLMMMQMSTALSPSLAFAAEMDVEVETSQTLETPEQTEITEPIEMEPTESVEEEVSQEEVTEEEVIEEPVEEVVEEATEDVVEETTEEVTEEAAPEEIPVEKPEEAPQMRTFAAQAAETIVDYVAVISKENNTIDTLPWGTPGFERLGFTKDFMGKTVRVTKHSANGAYGYIYIEGLGNGWVDLKALTKLDIIPVNYTDYVTAGKYEVDTLLWGTPGFKKLGTTAQYVGRQLHIRYKTMNNAYLYAELNGQAIGWIDAKAFGLAGSEYTAIITNGKYNVDTLPWGTPGFQTVALTDAYKGLELTVKGTTQNGSYLLVYSNGQEIGWIDKRAVQPFETKSVNYGAYIGSGRYNIDTLPYGTYGFRKIGSTDLILGNYVTVTRESSNGAYAYVVINNVGQGWVDKRALKLHGPAYPATVVNGAYNVDTLPWGTPGFQKITTTSSYVGVELDVRGTTENGAYALVYHNGKFVGWVDTKALKPMNYKSVNYSLEVSGGQYEVDSLPWGDYGFKKLGTTLPYVGLALQITKESSNGAYLYATLNGQEVGWIDKKAFGFSKLSYSFYITNGNYNLDTLPWGTRGFQTISLTKSLMGRELEVIAKTQNGAYLKVAHQGKVLGWIDAKAGRPLNEVNVNYSAVISRGGFTIDTLPWGTTGFLNRGMSGNHQGKRVNVTKESADGNYLFITEVDGSPMGWIDKKAMQFKRTVFLDVGHGGKDPGAVYYGVQEKDINMNISFKLQKALENAGYAVIMSRTTDTFIDHSVDRSKMANATGADIFISVHHNAMPNNTAVNGIETFWYEYDPDYPSRINQDMHNNPDRLLKSSVLATEIHNGLIRHTGAFNRGVRRDTFAVLRESKMPAALLEFGFMSNSAELNLLMSDSYQNKLVKGVVDGVNAYFQRY